jgi:hypothetical protein
MFGAVVGEVYSIQIMIAPLVSSNSSIQHYVIKFVRLSAGRLYSPGTAVSSTNKTDRHDITEKLLKVS